MTSDPDDICPFLYRYKHEKWQYQTHQRSKGKSPHASKSANIYWHQTSCPDNQKQWYSYLKQKSSSAPGASLSYCPHHPFYFALHLFQWDIFITPHSDLRIVSAAFYINDVLAKLIGITIFLSWDIPSKSSSFWIHHNIQLPSITIMVLPMGDCRY